MNSLLTKDKPLILKWFVTLFLMLSCNVVFADKVKDLNENWNIAMFIEHHKRSNSYTTHSRTVGEIQYTIKDQPTILKQIGEGNVKINLLTYPEFVDAINPRVSDLKYIDILGSKIEEYFNYLELKPFKLEFNLILLPENYGLLHSSKKKPYNQLPIDLTFVVTLPDGIHGKESLALQLIRILPHETFHILVGYKKLARMNQLRDETFAHLFGQCVAYEMDPIINDGVILIFPDYFFKNPVADFKKIKKEMKKDAFIKDSEFPNSLLGNNLARYYFQAVANNRTGKNISSEKIPKFCRKLFSEHDFKHPIEKKPPPWFKEFLDT